MRHILYLVLDPAQRLPWEGIPHCKKWPAANVSPGLVVVSVPPTCPWTPLPGSKVTVRPLLLSEPISPELPRPAYDSGILPRLLLSNP